LLDCIEIDLTEVDVFSATREKVEGGNFKFLRQVGMRLMHAIRQACIVD